MLLQTCVYKMCTVCADCEVFCQRTDGESSAALVLPFPDVSGPSSPAAIASMEAAMPALSFFENKQTVKFRIRSTAMDLNVFFPLCGVTLIFN